MFKKSACVILLCYLISFNKSKGCTENKSIVGYEHKPVNLLFIQNVPVNDVYAYKITMDDIDVLAVAYGPDGNVLGIITFFGVELIGNVTAGNLSIRIPSMNSTYERLFTLQRTNPYMPPKQCINLNMRARPNQPVLSGTVLDENGRIPCVEDKEVRITCTSTGGYPKPKMAWYKTSNQTVPLVNNANIAERDDRYYTLTYTFEPNRADDGKLFICQTSYDPLDPLYMNDNAVLYLSLKPSKPTLVITNPVNESQTRIEIATCATSGFRPDAVAVSWALDGNKTAASFTSVPSSGTFSVSSRYQRSVGRELNGKILGCVVNHTTLDAPLETIGILNVQFRPRTATISGNTTYIEADKGNNIELTCTSDSSNPRSNLAWYHNQKPTISNSQVHYGVGQYNGTVSSQIFVFENVQRSNDGDEIYCEILNTVNQKDPVKSDTKKLDMKYHPTLTLSNVKTANEGSSTSFTCEANSKPDPTFTWYLNDITFNISSVNNGKLSVLTIPRVNRNHSGTFRCKADNGYKPDGIKDTDLIVKFKPLTVDLIENAEHIVANGSNRVKLNCTSGSSNPISTILWYRNKEGTQNDATIRESTGENNGIKTSQMLDFVAKREMDGDKIYCTVHNNVDEQNPIYSDVITIDLMFHPIATVSADDEIVEGETITIRCKVNSKPESTLSWSHNGTALQSGTLVSSNVYEYTIIAANRSQAGTYGCLADNGYLPKGDSQTNLTVHYAPDVTVSATNVTVNDSSTDVTCIASGNQSTYTYSDWQHIWPGHGIVQHTNGIGRDPTLSLSSLTYEYTGIYRCTVSNGIQGSLNPNAGHGTAYLEVKTFPIIITPGTIQIYASLNDATIVPITFYSNIKVNTAECLRNNLQIDCSTSMAEKDVELPVFGTTISTKGIVADIELTIQNMDQFGLYNVKITNAIGSSKMVIVDIMHEGPPASPSDVTIDEVALNYVTLSWMPGSRDGFNQTFIIEYRRESQVWLPENKVVRHGGKLEQRINGTISNLQEQSRYYFRIKSETNRGSSGFTDILNVTTQVRQGEVDNTSSKTPIIAGAVTAGCIFAIVLAISALYWIRRRKRDDCQHSQISKARREATNTTEKTAETSINNIQHYYNIDRNPYEDLRRVNEDVHEYGTLNLFEGTVNQPNGDTVYENLAMSPVKRLE